MSAAADTSGWEEFMSWQEKCVKLTKLRGSECPDGRTCPAVHRTEAGSLLVVGSVVTDEDLLSQMAIGPGELAVEVPAGLLPELSGDPGC
jgi:hypothetical protein